MDALDPAAKPRLRRRLPVLRHAWSAPFDPGRRAVVAAAGRGRAPARRHRHARAAPWLDRSGDPRAAARRAGAPTCNWRRRAEPWTTCAACIPMARSPRRRRGSTCHRAWRLHRSRAIAPTRPRGSRAAVPARGAIGRVRRRARRSRLLPCRGREAARPSSTPSEAVARVDPIVGHEVAHRTPRAARPRAAPPTAQVAGGALPSSHRRSPGSSLQPRRRCCRLRPRWRQEAVAAASSPLPAPPPRLGPGQARERHCAPSCCASASPRADPAGPAPVVHVTIDRIDVRLPAGAGCARRRASARPAPASAVAPLSDYLRSGGAR